MLKRRSSAQIAVPAPAGPGEPGGPAPAASAPINPATPANPTPPEPPPVSSDFPDAERHSRKCIICHHPDRELIEDDFIHWVRPQSIICEYLLRDTKMLYRHARALGLDILRRRNLRDVLEPLFEHAPCVRVTAESLVSAVRAYSHLNDDGQWQEPPRESIITKRPYYFTREDPAWVARVEQARANVLAAKIQQREQDEAAAAAASAKAAAQSPPLTTQTAPPSGSNIQPPTSNLEVLIAPPKKLESRPTPTKQTTAPRSNRPYSRKKVLLRHRRTPRPWRPRKWSR